MFVGRCADYILRDFPNVLNIFVTADLNERAKMVAERNECSLDDAKKIIQNIESSRASYYNYYTGKRWGDSASYDLCVNSSLLGIDATTQFIAEFIHSTLNTPRSTKQ